MKDTIYTELHGALVRESLVVFKEILEQYSGVYVLGLYHLGGFNGVFPIFNSLDHVPEKPTHSEPEEMNAYCDAMWAPSSYPMLEDYTDRLPDSSAILEQLGQSDVNDKWDIAINTMVQAMKTIAHDPFFELKGNSPVFSVTTYDEAWSDRTPRVKEINTQEITSSILPDFLFMEKLEAEWMDDALKEVGE